MSRQDIKNRRQERIRNILKAATEVFAEKGYAGASANEIAARANTSKRTMYYYVGDKDNLYALVLKDLHTDIDRFINAIPGEEGQPEQKLNQFIKAMARAGNNRHIYTIWLRELFAGGEFIPRESVEAINNAARVLGDILRKGEEKDAFSRVDPVVLFMILNSLFSYWNFLMPYMAKQKIWGETMAAFGGERVTPQLVNEIQRLFMKLLKPDENACEERIKNTVARDRGLDTGMLSSSPLPR